MPNYQKIQKLGEGGFGEVWKVKKDLACNAWQFAAMKIVKNPDSSAWSEVGLLIRSQHKNVIHYFDSFRDVDTGDLCIVMEYCDRGTLANFIPQVSTYNNTFNRLSIHVFFSILGQQWA